MSTILFMVCNSSRFLYEAIWGDYIFVILVGCLGWVNAIYGRYIHHIWNFIKCLTIVNINAKIGVLLTLFRGTLLSSDG